MEKILEFLYRVNNECEIKEKFILEVYEEILNINDKEKSNVFISTLFIYMVLKRKDINIISKMLDKSFEKDKFKPFQIDICKKDIPIISISGSGKKGIKTINVSTASSIIATSLGANVIKPCSSSTSSLTGSFDLLEMLGVNTNLSIDDTKMLLDKTRIWTFRNRKADSIV